MELSHPTTVQPAGRQGHRLSKQAVAELVATATRAPSIFNSQPWKFRYEDGRLDLYADRERLAEVTDPAGRQLMISCGAAAFTLRLALRGQGLQDRVRVLPDALQPALVARVELRPGEPPTQTERALLAAVPHRHTHRGPFVREDLPDRLACELAAAVAEEGAAFRVVSHPAQLHRLLNVLTAAEVAQRDDPELRREVAAWTTPPGSRRPDGIPPTAYPAAGAPPSALPPRDFDQGRHWGLAPSPRQGEAATLGLLWTTGDSPAEWVRAGQALQRLLLIAAREWVFASFFTQPIESSDLRPLVRSAVGLVGGFPQMLLRLGRAGIAPTTPRRPVDAVLDE